MRDLHVTANKCAFPVVPRLRRGTWTAVLFLVMALLSLGGTIQAEETPPVPSDRDAYIAAADQARTESRFSDAVRLYSRAEKDFGPDARMFRGRAMAREMLKEDRKAIEDYKTALRTDARDYQSLERLAGIYERGGTRIAEAILLYKRALDLDPRPEWKDNLAAWIAILESRFRPDNATAVGCWHLGNDKAHKGDLSAAESLYSRAIELNPQLFQAHFSRGLIHLKAGDASAALADFEQTVRMAPEFAQAFLQRGLVREQLGNVREAREDFDRAAKRDPRDPAALYHCARSLESEDDQETCLKLYRDALRCKPTPELSAAIQEKLSALVSSLRMNKARNSGSSPETGSLW